MNPATMSALNIVFSKLEKFTGNGNVNLNEWLKNFERCCVIADKQDDLVRGQILMLCVGGRAKACLDQFEDSKQEPQKFSALKEQLKAIFDSPSDREAKMADFEQRIQHVDESEEEFMTSLLQTFRAANPSAKNEEIDRAVKRKFLQGIPVNLRRNLFIFCHNPYDTEVSIQDLLKASRDAIVHLSTSTSGPFEEQSPSKVLAASPTTSPPAPSTPLADTTLDAIMMLSSKFDEQAKITNKKLEAQQDEINALRSQFPVPVSQYQQFQQSGRPQRPRYTQNSRMPFQHPPTQFQPDRFRTSQSSSDVNIRCHFCHGLNHFKRDCLAFRQQQQQPHFEKSNQHSENFWGSR